MGVPPAEDMGINPLALPMGGKPMSEQNEKLLQEVADIIADVGTHIGKAEEIIAKVKQHYPIMYQEEAEFVGRLLDKGWIPPERYKINIEEAEKAIGFWREKCYTAEEAKKQERERIFTEGEKFFHPDPPYTDIEGFLKWWQSLGEEKQGNIEGHK